MGDAKRRGNLDERVRQAKAQQLPPNKGLYVSTRTGPKLRVVVENVVVFDDSDEESKGYFLVTVVDESDIDDMSAFSQEFDPDEWFSFVYEHGLVSDESGVAR